MTLQPIAVAPSPGSRPIPGARAAPPSASRSQAVLLVTAVFRLGLALAANVLLGRALAPRDFGFFVLIAALVAAAHDLLDLGTNNLAARQVMRDPSSERTLLEGLVAWRRLAGCVLGVALLPAALLEHDPDRRAVLLGLSALWPLLAPLGLYPAFQVRQRQMGPALATALSYLLVVVGVILLYQAGARGPAFAWLIIAREVVCSLVLRILGPRLLGYRPRAGLRNRNLKNFFGMALFYGGAALLHNLYFYADVGFVRVLRGEAELGAYAASFRLIYPLMALPWILAVPLVPVLSAEARRSAKLPAGQMRDLIAIVAGIGCIAAVSGILTAPDLITLIYHAGYTSGGLSTINAFRWLSAALGTVLVTAPLATALLALGRERALLALTAAGLLVNLAGNALAVPRFGITGAAAVTALTEGVVCLGALVILTRSMRRSLISWSSVILLAPGLVIAASLPSIAVAPPLRVGAAVGLGVLAVTCILHSPAARRYRRTLSARFPGPAKTLEACAASAGPASLLN